MDITESHMIQNRDICIVYEDIISLNIKKYFLCKENERNESELLLGMRKTNQPEHRFQD